MRNRLFIRIDDASGAAAGESMLALSWLAMDDASEPQGAVAHGRIQEALALAHGRQVIVLVPASDVLLARAIVPNVGRQRLAQAIPYALEDQLGSEVEDLHFALGRQTGQAISVAVVARGKMDAWLGYLRDAGFQPDLLVPSILGLPYEEGTWTVLREAGDALCRSGVQAGFAADHDNLEILLSLAITEAGDAVPARLRILDTPGAPALHAETWSQTLGVSVRREASAEDAVTLLARNFNEDLVINLLQGDYSRREQLEKLWRPWKPAAALLALWLVVYVGMTVSEVVSLSRQSPKLQKQIEQTYLQAFPDASKVVNPKVQMQRRLDALRGNKGEGGGLLELLAQAGGPLKDTPDLELRTITFKEGQLNLDLRVQDLQVLDQLKQRLAAQSKMEVEIQSASSRDNKVESRLQLRVKKS
ncbi:MAG TPA: type II secretion system protein GspL [Gammaproteobacteria bacterium]|nr:type II secretion system protein GspL [Gammaproteobacteria bacterium]